MAKYLCEDLRVRVIEAVRSGVSRRQAAARFGVSVSSAFRGPLMSQSPCVPHRVAGRTACAGDDLESADDRAANRRPGGQRSVGTAGRGRPGGCSQASYLKESETRVRNAATFPSLTVMSIFVTSATRRSRNEPAAVSTAFRPASSHEFSLTPTTSTIL